MLKIGLPLPFHNIKCSGNHPFSKLKWVVFILSKILLLPVTFFFCHLPSKSNIDVSRTCFARALYHLQLDFNMIFSYGYDNSKLFFSWKTLATFLVFLVLVQVRNFSAKFVSVTVGFFLICVLGRVVDYVARAALKPWLAWCAERVRTNKSRHRP